MPAKSPDAPAPAGTDFGLPEDVGIVEAEIAGAGNAVTEIAGMAETEIADVEVEEVSSVAATRVTEPTAHSSGIWQFPDDFLDGDTPPGGAAEPEPAPVQTAAPATPDLAPRERRKPPRNSGERLLGGLIAIALAILLGLGAYLFFLVSPESYAALRAKLPAGWTFLPDAESRNQEENPVGNE